ncbi:MAG: hypothetical protein VXZ96_13300 [Myxococcota bacterium]|nr:hypothetical protein [Myxococcota bacterium]
MRKNELTELAVTLILGWVTVAWLFPVGALLGGEYAIGDSTRDLFDHLFLLDQWTTVARGWNFPDGGRIMPPDISGMLFALPWFWLGRVTAYNLALLTQFTLTLWAGWLLGRQFGSGLVAGLAMGLSPIFISQLVSGEAETASAWTIPLFLYMLSKPHPNWAWRVGIVAAISGLLSWYYGVYVGLVLVGHSIYKSRFWTGKLVWAAFKPVSICLACIAPFAIWYGRILISGNELFRGLTMTDYMMSHPRALASFSADPLAWFFGSQYAASHSDFLGWLPLVFMGIGSVVLYRQSRFWALCFGTIILGAATFSLGPVLHFRGNPVFEALPYRALLYVPVFDLMRLPHRWMMLLVAASLPFIAAACRQNGLLFAGLLVAEVVWFSSPMCSLTEIRTPSIIDEYKGAILELPARTMGDDARGQYLLWQRVHEQPIPYSLLMTGWSSIVTHEPLVHWVSAQDSRDPIGERVVEAEQFRQGEFAAAVSDVKVQALEGAKDRLLEKGLWGVVLHLNLLEPANATVIQRMLEAQLGSPHFENDEAVLWKL